MANYDDELNGVSEAISTSVEEGLVGLIGATSGSFKSAQSGLKLLKDKLAQRKEAKSQVVLWSVALAMAEPAFPVPSGAGGPGSGR